MNEQIGYIRGLAGRYLELAGDSAGLYAALNSLGAAEVDAVWREYGESERYKPVNLLRAECARRLAAGITLDEVKVSEIREAVRERDAAYFSHLPAEYLEQFKSAPVSARNEFTNWQQPWRVFYPFFYRGVIKETVQIYLDQIARALIEQLELPDYSAHWVDFQGAQNFGETRCWLALYPSKKGSHKNSYQFFVNLGSNCEAGLLAGSALTKGHDRLVPFTDADELVRVLAGVKPEVIRLNDTGRSFYKYNAHPALFDPARFDEDLIGTSDWDSPVGNLSSVSSLDDINERLGKPRDGNSYLGSWNMWLMKDAREGDIVFISDGRNSCIGIAEIVGQYFFEAATETHLRRVRWITRKSYQYEPLSYLKYRQIFRPDFFAPTLVNDFLLSEYARIYPELTARFDELGLNYKLTATTPDEVTDDDASGLPERSEINYWWLNANPNIWSIASFAEGQRQAYTARNEKGNKRRIYRHFESVQPGDQVIGYESSPSKQIRAIFEVTRPLHTTEEGELIEFELTEKLEVPVFWNELQGNPALANCEPLINNQGSLFKLTEDEFDLIREIIDAKNIEVKPDARALELKPYSFADDPDRPFISSTEFERTVEILRRKKNIILQGAPGVGKTFIARKIAYQLIGHRTDAQIEMVQFHQSFSYEDFIQGLRPTRNGGFELRNGVFYRFCWQALAQPDRRFVMIIDEINRGNLSKIFGELMMLIESDKRHKKYALNLTYSEDQADRFYVPENLYIIGTMNTADRSLAMVDYALRRRFAFISLRPELGDLLKEHLVACGVSESFAGSIISSVGRINTVIRNDHNLGPGFEIGHSYFCGKPTDIDERRWFKEVVSFEIRPLLEELWFDDPQKVDEMIGYLDI